MSAGVRLNWFVPVNETLCKVSMRWPTEMFSTDAVWRDVCEEMRDDKSDNAASMRASDCWSMMLVWVLIVLAISVIG